MSAASELKSYGIIILTFAGVVLAQGLYFRYAPHDSTDDVPARSGMTIRTDNHTGCEYLDRDGLTPRIGQDGKTHLGCKRGAMKTSELTGAVLVERAK